MGNITFLGVEGSGKTVLMMALVKSFLEHRNEGWSVEPNTRSAMRFLASIPDEMTMDNLPSQTALMKRLALQIKHNDETVCDLNMLDYPGEIYRLAFLDPDEAENREEAQAKIDANRAEINELLSCVTNSEHVFVLFNPEDGQNIATNERNLDSVWVTNDCFKFLTRIPNKPKVTAVLTQMDKFVDIDDANFQPETFLKENIPFLNLGEAKKDLIAISAMKKGSGSFSLNQIIYRCLASKIPDYEKLIKKGEILLDQIISSNIPPHKDDVRKMIESVDLVLRNCLLENWIIPNSNTNECLYDIKDKFFCIRTILVNSLNVIGNLHMIRNGVINFNPKTSYGLCYKNQILQKIDECVQASWQSQINQYTKSENYEKEESASGTRGCVIVIILILIILLVVNMA